VGRRGHGNSRCVPWSVLHPRRGGAVGVGSVPALAGSTASGGRPQLPALAHPVVSISVDLSHPLTVLGLVLLLVVALIRRWVPQQLQHRLYRGLQIVGGILALLQPGLLLGAAITAAICRERPRAFRFLFRGCAAIPAILMLAFGAWCSG
jgi:hypothetical protein